MFFFSDLLLIALVMKLLWETYTSNLMPKELFVIAVFGLPFLWGMGGRGLNKVMREGAAIAGLLIFVVNLHAQKFHGFFIAIICLGIILYMWGRLTKRAIRYLVVAVSILVIIAYFLIRT